VSPLERLPDSLRTALGRTKLLALDVDGVMTDGRVVYSAATPGLGVHEQQSFDVQDGIALRWLSKCGVKIVWITGRGCAVTAHRANELKIDVLEMDVVSKREVLERLQAQFEAGVDETVAMGDDLPDLGMRARAGVFAAPSNARPEILACSDLRLARRGGDGAVRELAEHILRARGRWDEIVEAARR